MTRCYIASARCASLDLSMSRSSKGFADFFPTAPSVLQQKKSRTAEERKRQDSSTSAYLATTSSHTPTSSDHNTLGAKKADRRNGSLTNGLNHDRSATDALPPNQDESESIQGDLLNGVGSASSTSTASSVFDANQRQLDPAQQKRHAQTELTPLTTIDSSSPGRNQSPAYTKPETSLAPRPDSSRVLPPTSVRPPTSMPAKEEVAWKSGARPGKGQAKGVKATYDPELDKTISSKERRSRQPVYKDIIADVSHLRT